MERLIASLKQSLQHYDRCLERSVDASTRAALLGLRIRRARQLAELERALFVLGRPHVHGSESMRMLGEPKGTCAWDACRAMEDRIAAELHDLFMIHDLLPGLRSLLRNMMVQVRVMMSDLLSYSRDDSLQAA